MRRRDCNAIAKHLPSLAVVGLVSLIGMSGNVQFVGHFTEGECRIHHELNVATRTETRSLLVVVHEGECSN